MWCTWHRCNFCHAQYFLYLHNFDAIFFMFKMKGYPLDNRVIFIFYHIIHLLLSYFFRNRYIPSHFSDIYRPIQFTAFSMPTSYISPGCCPLLSIVEKPSLFNNAHIWSITVPASHDRVVFEVRQRTSSGFNVMTSPILSHAKPH